MNGLEHPYLALARLSISIQRLSKASEDRCGMTIVQWCLLQRLVDLPGVSAQSLAQAVGVHPSTLTQSLKRLLRKGLIFMAVDPCDSRRKTISITRKGKEALDSADRLLNPSETVTKELWGAIRAVDAFVLDQLHPTNGSDRKTAGRRRTA